MKKIYLILLCLLPFLGNAQTITLFAGSGSIIGDGGPATAAILNQANGGAFDKHGNYYVAEVIGHRVRKIDPYGIITRVAGTGTSGFAGDGGPATAANLSMPTALAIDTFDNIYIADLNNFRIRKVDGASGIISTIAGNGSWGFFGEGVSSTAAQIAAIEDICIDKWGNIYFADRDNNRVRKINTAGIISTFAGTGTFTSTGTGDGGSATLATFNLITGVTVDDTGNVYIADYNDGKIRKVNTSGIITTIAGNGIATYSGDGIPATSAQFNPIRLTFDNSKNLVIADRINRRVYRIDKITNIFYNIAGNGGTGSGGDGGQATAASLDFPAGVVYDECGNLYIAESRDKRVRKVNYGISVIPSISVSASTGSTLCSGTSVTYTATISNGGSAPAYQWYVNGSIVSGSSSYTYTPTNLDSIRCVLTSSNHCAVPITAYSNTIKMTVNPTVIPAITITASTGSTVCAGTSVTYTSATSNGGSSPVYQWYLNGSIVSGSSSYTYTPSNLDSIRCVLTSSSSCVTPIKAYSNSFTMTVNPVVPAIITIAATPGTIVCTGTSVTFLASIAGGGSSPTYKWYVNGSVVSTTSSSYAYIPSNNDSIRCVLISSSACASPANAYSNTIKMTVNSTIVPVVTISAIPSVSVCTGSSVTFAASVTGGGSSPAFKWFVNGSVVSTTGGTYTYTPANNDSVRCVLVSSSACATPGTAYSNSITMTVSPLLTPAVSITASPSGSICVGTPVSYTSSIIAGGSSPVYRWYVNGSLVSSSSSIYTYAPANGDSIYCVLTSSYPCSAVAAVSSNVIKMVVDPVVMPSVTITASPGDTVCAGSAASFSATTINAGASPSFQWFVNGSSAGTTGSYTYVPSNADAVYCVLTGSALCSSPTVVNSNTLTMHVDVHTSPSISISGVASAPAYSTVTVTATVSGTSGGYFIRWFNDGFPIAVTTDTSIIYTKIKDVDSITAIIVAASGACMDSSISGIHLVTMANTGIADVVSFPVRIFPNPTAGAFEVTAVVKIKSISVSSLIGKIVYNKAFDSNSAHIEIGPLPPGVYLVQVQDIDGHKTIMKLVKD